MVTTYFDQSKLKILECNAELNDQKDDQIRPTYDVDQINNVFADENNISDFSFDVKSSFKSATFLCKEHS